MTQCSTLGYVWYIVLIRFGIRIDGRVAGLSSTGVLLILIDSRCNLYGMIVVDVLVNMRSRFYGGVPSPSCSLRTIALDDRSVEFATLVVFSTFECFKQG
jgi:hypothetical protein